MKILLISGLAPVCLSLPQVTYLYHFCIIRSIKRWKIWSFYYLILFLLFLSVKCFPVVISIFHLFWFGWTLFSLIFPRMIHINNFVQAHKCCESILFAFSLQVHFRQHMARVTSLLRFGEGPGSNTWDTGLQKNKYVLDNMVSHATYLGKCVIVGYTITNYQWGSLLDKKHFKLSCQCADGIYWELTHCSLFHLTHTDVYFILINLFHFILKIQKGSTLEWRN